MSVVFTNKHFCKLCVTSISCMCYIGVVEYVPGDIKRYFLNIVFLNKGIAIITINSILNDKNVVTYISQ